MSSQPPNPPPLDGCNCPTSISGAAVATTFATVCGTGPFRRLAFAFAVWHTMLAVMLVTSKIFASKGTHKILHASLTADFRLIRSGEHMIRGSNRRISMWEDAGIPKNCGLLNASAPGKVKVCFPTCGHVYHGFSCKPSCTPDLRGSLYISLN
ncbi:hypothetical protein ABEF92_003431 [Exophiala dermatitidis]|uniref:Uncharacterized protein n=1 Tax=Exophiala dermatitidis (strain ATCC 34100 / CBS 525.76 / NIH/UT8656) TaxID=858893 RepID=H6BTB1_EXODN|nr:uncharacterized protein HMPREF1120_01698 [Exophiala dermatitidis NIH/UT8656]EHY53507.1 hypothetical protein HMPREF1120_01698 [Exophiala dermatitidis NIH/UT8656]